MSISKLKRRPDWTCTVLPMFSERMHQLGLRRGAAALACASKILAEVHERIERDNVSLFMASGPGVKQLAKFYDDGHRYISKADFMSCRPTAYDMATHGFRIMGFSINEEEFLSARPTAYDMAAHGFRMMGLIFTKEEFLSARPTAYDMATHGFRMMGLIFTKEEFLPSNTMPCQMSDART
jgi:hypothetical protein